MIGNLELLCTMYLSSIFTQGTIYIEEHDEEKKKTQKKQDKKSQLFTYYGYKFESVSTHDSLHEDVDLDDKTVDTNIQYCSVFKTALGSHSLVLGAEVDCVMNSKDPATRTSNYVELKTNRIITHSNQRINFERHKLLKIWCQSFLAGIPTVIIGYRTDEGYLDSIETFETLKIPRMVRGKNLWDFNLCLSVADDFLRFLTRKITVDDPNVTYTIQKSQGLINLKGPFRDVNVFIPKDYV
jgi:RAT1-interacting protein